VMDDPGIGELFEWVHGVVEQRCGKFWAWTIYFGLVAASIFLAIRLILRF